MKQLIAMIIVLLLCSSVHAEGLTMWVMGGIDIDNPGNEVSGRIGYVKNDIEVGLSSTWWPSSEPPQVYGLYGIYQFADPIKIPQFLPLPWLPTELIAQPYIGGQVTVDFENDGSFVGPMAGIKIQNILAIEYQYRKYDEALGAMLDDEGRVLFSVCYAF